jgi:hypothetical protein
VRQDRPASRRGADRLSGGYRLTRTILSIADEHRQAIEDWLARGATAWRAALEPLTPEQRQVFIDTLKAYERGVGGVGH